MVLFLSNEGQVADSEGVGSLGAYSFLLLEQQISFKRQDSLLPLTHVKTLFPFASSCPDWSLSYRPRDCKAKSGSITRVPNPRIFQKECRITHRIRNINDLLTLACGLGFGPLSIRLASPSEVSNKFVLRVTFKNYNALIGKCVSVPDAIGRRARITAANDCK